MLPDAKEPNSPAWWLLRLGERLEKDQPRFDRLECYWRGDPPLPHGNRKMREAYRRLQKLARTNFGALVAETLLERLKVVGFRAGSDATEEADKQSWQWWQRNDLDADSGLVHRAAVVMSKAYVIVGPDPSNQGHPLVTAEDPRQVAHEADPTNRRIIRAALKTWWDDVANAQLATVYLPDAVHYYRTTASVKRDSSTSPWVATSWEPDLSEDYPDGSAPNPLGEVPVTPFVNRPDMSGDGLGEFEDTCDVLDRINTVILDRLVVSAMQAYRQRYATGVDLTDEDGNPSAEFDPGADLLWAVPDDKAKFGEFAPTDLTPIIKAIEADVQHLGAITRTPPHYLLAAMTNISGDALAAAETGLASKASERIIEYGNSWERVHRQVGKLQGREIGPDAEVLWRDPQFHSLSQMAAANVQLMQAGVPWRTRMRMLDMSPAEIDRMEAERAHDAMLAATLAPLSIAEGGQLGTRGVGYTDKGMPQDPNAPGASPTPAQQPAGSPQPVPAGANSPRGPRSGQTPKP